MLAYHLAIGKEWHVEVGGPRGEATLVGLGVSPNFPMAPKHFGILH